MKFASRKDTFFKVLIYGICLFLFLLLIEGILHWDEESSVYFFIVTMGAIIVFLLWIFHGTSYWITPTHFSYRMAFIRGKIPIESITELEIGTTMWAGYKIATARNGIVLKYNKYDEIYISPDSNERFAEKIVEGNPKVRIVNNEEN